jgi:hypothetical protein
LVGYFDFDIELVPDHLTAHRHVRDIGLPASERRCLNPDVGTVPAANCHLSVTTRDGDPVNLVSRDGIFDRLRLPVDIARDGTARQERRRRDSERPEECTACRP